MKLQKILFQSFSMLFVMIAAYVMPSCSSSDDIGGSNSEIVEKLKQSKWICRDVSSGVGSNDHAWVDFETNTLYFTSDNAGVAYWMQRDYDTDLGNSRHYDYDGFSYSVDGKRVILSFDGNTTELLYEGSYLSFNGGIYEKTAMSSGDYELLKKISPKSGSCGIGLTYTYYPKTKGLVISGKGRMYDYVASNQPWKDFYIESVSFDEGCTYIGVKAFADIPHLSEVSLPRTLEEIGSYAFSGTLLTSVSIPDNVRMIDEGAFSDCNYLGTVYLSDNLVTVGSGAFSDCAIKYHNLSLPDNVETVGDYAFSGWQAGTLTLNNKLKTVGKGAFVGVKGTLTIPNSVESIDFLAFEGTYSKIVIGTGLKQLSRAAFTGSSSGGNMYVNLGIPLKLENPLSEDDAIFAEDNVQYKWNLYVPKGSKSVYASDGSWKKFKNIYEDASLVSGNGMPEESGSGDSSGDRKPAMDYRNVTYSLVGDTRTFKLVRVEGGGLHPFYIMQTEIPIHSQIKFGNRENILPLDRNGDGIVIKYEFRQFIDAIRAETGLDFRFPTLAEWQYAAKGGKKSKGYKYSGSNNIDDVAWYKDNSNGYVHDIALKQPNELGLYDMSGNYAEVASDFDDIYIIDAYDCGGSWKHTSSNCLPSSYELDSRSNTKISGTAYRNKNAIDSRYISVRLVYTEPD